MSKTDYIHLHGWAHRGSFWSSQGPRDCPCLMFGELHRQISQAQKPLGCFWPAKPRVFQTQLVRKRLRRYFSTCKTNRKDLLGSHPPGSIKPQSLCLYWERVALTLHTQLLLQTYPVTNSPIPSWVSHFFHGIILSHLPQMSSMVNSSSLPSALKMQSRTVWKCQEFP